MQARGLLNYRLKYCWPKVIYSSLYVNQTNLNGKLRKTWGDQGKICLAPLRITTACCYQ